MSYLNFNSTALIGGKNKFNPVDKYPENEKLKFQELEVKNYIRKKIGAHKDSKVIFTSGATESIATVLNWIKEYNKYGTIYGSDFDHESVKLNCDNLKIKYEQIDIDEILSEKEKLKHNCSALFITHVNPYSGEIYPFEEINKIFKSQFKEEITVDENEFDYNNAPFKILDASQSIGKTKIEMEKWGLNAVFFSLHKLGGKLNCGVLVVRDTNKTKFKPLISGKQQSGLRGGTYDLYSYLNFQNVYEKFLENYDPEECKSLWKKMFDEFKLHGLDVYEPKHKHLFNTILIRTKTCSLPIINELAKNNIYVSGKTACENETDDVSTIRISFINNQISDKIIRKIINIIQEHEMDY